MIYDLRCIDECFGEFDAQVDLGPWHAAHSAVGRLLRDQICTT